VRNMGTQIERPEAFIFMKVGEHAGEAWEAILERKNKEYQAAGRIFWGYGGTTCHPLRQVQPFARRQAKKQGAIYLLMEPIVSHALPEVLPATEYSADGVNWQPIPQGVNVIGSRYALVLDEIRPGDLEIDTDSYAVGIGPSRGKHATDYIQGRVDKACLERAPVPRSAGPSGTVRVTKFTAKLLEPYAVLLRHRD